MEETLSAYKDFCDQYGGIPHNDDLDGVLETYQKNKAPKQSPTPWYMEPFFIVVGLFVFGALFLR